MDTSILIGRILAVIYLTVGVGMALNKQFYQEMIEDFCENKALLYFGGVMALAVGFLIVTFHNDWTISWTILITLIGWMGLAKGIWILIFPKMAIRKSRKWAQSIQWAINSALIIGIILGYCSFVLN